jgi:predicted small lipoprotein YifL
MNSLQKTTAILAVLLLVAGCGLKPRTEMPEDGTGSDAMRQSPCVGAEGSPCAPLDYDGRGYTWRS